MRYTKIVLALLALISFTACNNYGKKVSKGHIETYYKEGITEDEAQKTANLVFDIDEAAHNAKVQKSFQLCKTHDTVCLRMVIDKEKAKGISDFNFLAIANMVSDSVFKGAPVNLDLTTNTFESIRMIPYKKINFDEPDKGTQ